MGGGELENLFCRFASFGKSEIQTEIDCSKFHKFCKDCKLLDRSFTKTDADIIFTKAKPMGERRLNFDKFCYALTLIGEKKGLTNDQLVDRILASRGPKVNGTIADPVRFHDDLSKYTVIHSCLSNYMYLYLSIYTYVYTYLSQGRMVISIYLCTSISINIYHIHTLSQVRILEYL